MPASLPRKSSPTPATPATAVRGKSGRPARPSCGNIIPPARGKPRPWPFISSRSAAIRGRSNSGGPQPWARARRPRRGATKATAVGRRSRANPRLARLRRAQPVLVVLPRAWKRAICRSLPRREAPARLVRRKRSWRHRRGRTPSKTSRNSARAVRGTALRTARQLRALFFLRFGVCWRGLVCGLTRASRLDRLRLEERSEEHTSELQSRRDLVCRLLLEKKKHLQNDLLLSKLTISTSMKEH